jgi:hypothetical protein
MHSDPSQRAGRRLQGNNKKMNKISGEEVDPLTASEVHIESKDVVQRHDKATELILERQTRDEDLSAVGKEELSPNERGEATPQSPRHCRRGAATRKLCASQARLG